MIHKIASNAKGALGKEIRQWLKAFAGFLYLFSLTLMKIWPSMAIV
ncbi:hypothetical protein UF75_0589 [Desulfosporosinus sp. I2]|nr:hypothetical protein UF75_0589 [Desulfosporosinus sp. I2]